MYKNFASSWVFRLATKMKNILSIPWKKTYKIATTVGGRGRKKTLHNFICRRCISSDLSSSKFHFQLSTIEHSMHFYRKKLNYFFSHFPLFSWILIRLFAIDIEVSILFSCIPNENFKVLCLPNKTITMERRNKHCFACYYIVR